MPILMILPPHDSSTSNSNIMPAAQNRSSSVTSTSASGLPRSRACITCRRRKVKCGEEKPHCLRCVTRGCHCEGYDSAQARDIKTQQALLKRWRPEPTKPGKTSLKNLQHVFAVSIGAEDSSSSTDVTMTSDSSPSAAPSSSPSPMLVDPASPSDIPTIRSPSVADSRIFRAFLDRYLPNTNEPMSTVNPWLYQCFQDQDISVTPTLNATLRAVALTRVGRAQGDDALLAQGKQLYVQALQKFQKNLLDPDALSTDTALLSARALSLYELFEHSDALGWLRHQQGLEALVQARGPAKFRQESRQATLNGFKDVAMIKAMNLRRKPFLTSANWRAEPMPNPITVDDFQENVVDIGLLTADVLADCNSGVNKLEEGTLTLEDVDSRYAALTNIDRLLNQWILQFTVAMPTPLYAVHSETSFEMDIFSETSPDCDFQDKLSYRFPTSKHAVAMLYYWTISLIVDMIFEEFGDLTGVPWLPPSPEMLDMDARLARRLELCANIMRTVSTLMLEDQGAIGATRCLLPWDVAMGALQKEEGLMAAALLRRGKELHMNYISSKGMSIVGRGQFRGQSPGPVKDEAGWPVRRRILLHGKAGISAPLYMEWDQSPTQSEEPLPTML